MKHESQRQHLAELKRLLSHCSPGPLENSEVESLLEGCWDLLGGSTQESTFASKLAGRMENVQWEPPNLHFQIERHGGLKMGSSRAEIHDWCVNLENEQATCSTGGYRQLRPRATALNVIPLVEKTVRSVLSGEAAPFLKWVNMEKVRVRVRMLIPSDRPKQTITGRRRRYRNKLDEKLAPLGWHRAAGAGPYTYEREPGQRAPAHHMASATRPVRGDEGGTQAGANPAVTNGSGISERTVRQRANRLGFVLQKSRSRKDESPDYGTYRLIDSDLNAVVCKGATGQFGLTLEQANDCIEKGIA